MASRLLNGMIAGFLLVLLAAPIAAGDIPGYSYCFDALEAAHAQCGDVLVWDGVYPNNRYFIIDVPANSRLMLYPDFDPSWGTGNYPRCLADQNGGCYLTSVKEPVWDPELGDHGAWYLNPEDDCLDVDWTRTVYFQFFNAYRIEVVCMECQTAVEPSAWGAIKAMYAN